MKNQVYNYYTALVMPRGKCTKTVPLLSKTGTCTSLLLKDILALQNLSTHDYPAVFLYVHLGLML